MTDYHREAFFDFFGLDPISLHAHVSDAQSPILLGTILLAKQQKWPQQAVKIGALLSKTLGEVSTDPAVIKQLTHLPFIRQWHLSYCYLSRIPQESSSYFSSSQRM